MIDYTNVPLYLASETSLAMTQSQKDIGQKELIKGKSNILDQKSGEAATTVYTKFSQTQKQAWNIITTNSLRLTLNSVRLAEVFEKRIDYLPCVSR